MPGWLKVHMRNVLHKLQLIKPNQSLGLWCYSTWIWLHDLQNECNCLQTGATKTWANLCWSMSTHGQTAGDLLQLLQHMDKLLQDHPCRSITADQCQPTQESQYSRSPLWINLCWSITHCHNVNSHKHLLPNTHMLLQQHIALLKSWPSLAQYSMLLCSILRISNWNNCTRIT